MLLLAARAAAARAQENAGAAGAAAPSPAPHIILPGAPFGQPGTSPLIVAPAPSIILPAPAQALIIPAAPAIAAPEPMILPAARSLTEAELAQAKLPSQGELNKLAESLSPQGAKSAPGPRRDAGQSPALNAAFDGARAPEANDWNALAPRFAQGPLAPSLPEVGAAARSLIARLLPPLYRRVPARAAYDQSARPATGHTWTPERGHLIEINPVGADARGEVPSAFGDGRTLVQQKMERLMEFAHEYFHVVFDAAVGRTENHPMHSVFAAMTEGFAVSGEQLLIEKLLDNVLPLGLGPRDAADLLAISRARRDWLDVNDNHYSEGILAWRKAYAQAGLKGILELLGSLSAHRMAATPRSDSAYQLALGEPKLVAAYVGKGDASAERRGLLAYAKAAGGEKLTDEEARDASAVAAEAGPDAWRRVFERTLFADKRLKGAGAERAADRGGDWWKTQAEPMASVEPAFALARLSPAAGAALSHLLAETIRSSGGAISLFERAGPNEKLNALLSGAESLPWNEEDRKAWNDGVTRWLMGTI